MIPDSAIEAAHKAWREQAKQDGTIFEYNLRAAIEAAVEVALTHEREETRLAHLDAVVNAETVGKYTAVVDALYAWAGKSKSAYYDEAQDDVVEIIRRGLN